eukprot:jgi/Hompol1/6805/HPOL_002291-RA
MIAMSVKCHLHEVELVSGIAIVKNKEKLIEMIFNSMASFELNPMFQITACFALAHIFFNYTFDAYRGLKCLVAVIRKYPMHESLQTTALFALGSIVMKSERYRDYVLEFDGIRLIMDAMKRDFSAPKRRSGISVLCQNFSDMQVDGMDRAGDSSANQEESTSISVLDQLINAEYPDDEIDQDSEDRGNPEPVLYSKAKCREVIIENGGVHYIFEASRRVAEYTDLWFIIYYIFAKFTKCGEERIVYAKRKGSIQSSKPC